MAIGAHTVERALAAGFAAYLPKPSKLAVIVATIMDVLDDEHTPSK